MRSGAPSSSSSTSEATSIGDYDLRAAMGAYTQLWGATVATPAQITGQYLVPWGKVGKANKRASNTKLEEEVVAYIRDQIKDFWRREVLFEPDSALGVSSV
ncbi:hypothetical protein B0H14DRAFT_3899244 [Mycena olivaceomarginata]|nr:hypothetical protein B0H14DRAFT_3899244 [Mycena olivaceomarginata]